MTLHAFLVVWHAHELHVAQAYTYGVRPWRFLFGVGLA